MRQMGQRDCELWLIVPISPICLIGPIIFYTKKRAII